MATPKRAETYVIRETFHAPLDYAYRWCTDYTPGDGKLSKEGNARQILKRTKAKVVYEDLYTSPHGWMWSRQTVTLHPPNRWTATANGNYRLWDLEYTLRPLTDRTTEFTMKGLRRPVLLGTENPSHRAMEEELHHMWRNLAKALETDYRRSRRPSR